MERVNSPGVKSLLFTIIFFSYLSVYAQLVNKWGTVYNNLSGTHSFDIPTNAVTDNSGNVYTIVQSYHSKKDGNDPEPGFLNHNTLLKYDISGNLVFKKRLTYHAFLRAIDLVIDKSNNELYALFAYKSTNTYWTEYLVVKYDALGNELWQKISPDNQHTLRRIVLDKSKNVLVFGITKVAKYTSSGTYLWTQAINGTNTSIQNFSIDSLNNICVVGSKNYNFYVAKYDSNGVYKWEQSLYESSLYNGATVVETDKVGNIYAGGYFKQGATSANKASIVKFRSNGDTVWKRSYSVYPPPGGGADTTKCITVAGNGDVYVTAHNAGLMNIRKYDSLGVLQWTQNYNAGSPYYLQSKQILIEGNSVLVYGGTRSNQGYGWGGKMILIKYDALGGTQQWIKTKTGNCTLTYRFGGGTSISKDINGDIVACAYTHDNFTYSNLHLVKYQINGTELYDKVYDEHEVARDAAQKTLVNQSKEIVIMGYSQDSLIQADNGGTTQYNCSIFLKYDSLGNKTWEKIIHASGPSDGLLADFVLDGNEIITVQNFSNSDIKVMKFDNNGSVLFSKNYFMPGFIGCRNILKDNLGNLILICTNGIMKCNSVGDTLWTAQNSPLNNYGFNQNADVDSQGNIYILHFQEAAPVIPYIAKYLPSGGLVWDIMAYSHKTKIKINAQDELVTVSEFSTSQNDFCIRTRKHNTSNGLEMMADTFWIHSSGTVYSPIGGKLLLDNSSNIYHVTYITDNYNYSVVASKLSSNGTVLWRRKIIAPPSPHLFTVSDACLDNNGALIFGGVYKQTSTIGLGGRMMFRLDDNGIRKDSVIYNDQYTQFETRNVVASGGLIYGIGYNDLDITLNCYRISDDLVWPGDVNNDGISNNMDILELGIHYGHSGAARATNSNLWQGFNAPNWTGLLSNGKNEKHSDCNGDGTVDVNDTLAIYNNYGLTHAFKVAQPTIVNSLLSIVPDQTSVVKGAWGSASIYLGDAANQISNINGIAFTVDFDNTLIETNSIYIEYENSFLDGSNQNLNFRKLNFSSGKIFTATTHTNNINASGYGKIATLHYKIKSSLTSDEVLNVGLSQANKSDVSGVISPLTSGTGTLMALGSSVGLNNLLVDDLISISPNPASNELTVRSSSDIEKVEITNTTGQIVMSEDANSKNHKMNLENVANGVYFVKVYNSSKQVSVRKLVVQK